MQRSDISDALHTYISTELLDGQNKGLDEQTPLLEWGLIDSFSLVRLISFIHQRFGVELKPEEMKPETFRSIAALTDFLSGQVKAA